MKADKHQIHEEAFYHFVWQHKMYQLQNLKTECGLPVEVIHPGLLSFDAGPDFFNSKIKIGGVLWVGNVEIHTDSSHWQQHKHHENPAYDNVILHVVASYKSPVLNSQGHLIPTLVIKPEATVLDQYDRLKLSKTDIRCSSVLKGVPSIFYHNLLDRLVSERLQRKSEAILAVVESSHGNWEQAFFQNLCRSLGFGLNADAFERLGRSLDYRYIAKHRDQPVQLEALLYGQAGFLNEEPLDSYQGLIRKEYNFLKAKYQLVPLEKHVWKFLRLRPGNFPTVRIAQLASLLSSYSDLLHQVIKLPIKEVEKLLEVSTSNYWKTHYQFGVESTKRKKTLGKTARQIIMINAVVPFLFAYGKSRSQEELCDKALMILEQLPAEKNYITNKWAALGLASESAYDSQAQIQLYSEYCRYNKCLHCNIGHQFLGQKNDSNY